MHLFKFLFQVQQLACIADARNKRVQERMVHMKETPEAINLFLAPAMQAVQQHKCYPGKTANIL